MIVKKIGGTSLANANNIKNVARTICESGNSQTTTVVLSAISSMTNKLVEIINTSKKDHNWGHDFKHLQDKHQQNLLDLDTDNEILLTHHQKHIDDLCQYASKFLQGVALLRHYPEDIYASIITLSEKLSVVLMHAQLKGTQISVELIDTGSIIMACQNIDEFMKKLPPIDEHIKQPNDQAQQKGCVLRYVGNISDKGYRVAIKAVDQSSALYTIKDGENATTFCSKYYQPIPMVLRGHGPGAAMTTAGMFANVLKIVPSQSSYLS